MLNHAGAPARKSNRIARVKSEAPITRKERCAIPFPLVGFSAARSSVRGPFSLSRHAAFALLPSATFSAPAADQPRRGPPAGLNSAAAVAAHFPPIFGLSLGSGFWRNLDGTKKKRDHRLPEISPVFGLGKGVDRQCRPQRSQQPRDETSQ